MAYNPMMYYPQSNYPPVPYQQVQQPAGRMVEAIPVDSEKSAIDYPVAVGATVVLFARDDSFIAVKTAALNGPGSFDIYDKRPPAPPQPVFDPAAYVTKAELEKRLEALQASGRKDRSEAPE